MLLVVVLVVVLVLVALVLVPVLMSFSSLLLLLAMVCHLCCVRLHYLVVCVFGVGAVVVVGVGGVS